MPASDYLNPASRGGGGANAYLYPSLKEGAVGRLDGCSIKKAAENKSLPPENISHLNLPLQFLIKSKKKSITSSNLRTIKPE